jgi:hypothetical protein
MHIEINHFRARYHELRQKTERTERLAVAMAWRVRALGNPQCQPDFWALLGGSLG